MSSDLHIACRDCQKTLWIAQDGLSGRTLYTGEPKTMEKLKDFLFDHEGHTLVFEDWQFHEGFEEIE